MCLECGKPLQTAADKARRRCADCPAPYDEALFERLREWRTERAREEEIAAFMVFSNATLEEIATRRPQSSRELLKVSGVGQEKLAEVRRGAPRARQLTAPARQVGRKLSRNTHKINCPLPGPVDTLLVPTRSRITGLTTPAHEAAKEVAQMITNTIKTAVQIPSGFGMPACGHAFPLTSSAGVRHDDRRARPPGDRRQG